MRTPEQARTRLQTTWSRQWCEWACGQGSWPLTLTLSPPSEREAVRAWARFEQWRRSWQTLQAGRVETITRRWTGLGVQTLPSRIVFESARELAAFLGSDWLGRWDQASARHTTLSQQLAPTADLSGVIDWLSRASEQDCQRAMDIARWLHAHPQSDLYVRQIPVPGVDTKWVERNRGVIAELLAALKGEKLTGRFEPAAGLRQDRPKCRFRLLDPDMRAGFGGLEDISTPLDDLARNPIPAKWVIVVENLQTFLACSDLPHAVVTFGAGFSATELAKLPWLSQMPLVYWGDLDTAGFEILNALRAHFAHIQSFGMDETTLLAHRHLWAPDPKQRRIELAHLSEQERSVYLSLCDGRHGQTGVRLEQERLDWASLWPALASLAPQE